MLLMKKLFYLTIPILFLTFGSNTNALEINVGTDISVTGEYESNYYVAGGDIEISSESKFNNDLFVVGGNTKISGEVNNDVIVIAGESFVNNYVAGDLRVLGGIVNISSTIDGDLVVIGGEVYLLPGANIRGDTIVISGKIYQQSDLNNTTNIISGYVSLDGNVNGDTNVTTQSITFDDDVNIVGNLRYYAPVKAVEIEGSKVEGNVIFNEIKSINEVGIVKSTIINLLNLWLILKFITTLILAFIIIHVFRVFSQRVNDLASEKMLKTFFIGLFSNIFVPFIFIILMISLIGLPLAFILLLLYILLYILATPIAGIIIGHLVAHMFGKDTSKVNFQNTVIGVILITVIQFVPIIGDLTIFIFTLIALGAMILYIYNSFIKLK